MPGHEVLLRLDISERSRRRRLPRVIQRVASNVIILQELLLDIFRQLLVSRSRVGVLGRATHTLRRQLMRTKEAVASPAWIEGAVDVEEGVSLEQSLSTMVLYRLASYD